MQIALEKVGPRLANIWLQKSNLNRPLSRSNVANLISVLKRGEWVTKAVGNALMHLPHINGGEDEAYHNAIADLMDAYAPFNPAEAHTNGGGDE